MELQKLKKELQKLFGHMIKEKNIKKFPDE